MNDLDRLLNSISNRVVQLSDTNSSFLDEETARVISSVNIKLRNDRRINNIPENVADGLLRKASEYIRLMGQSFSLYEEDILFDEFVDDSIAVFFKKRKDMILNIYSNNDIEEAYLSYNAEGDDMLVYNSLPVIVDLVKRLLEHEV